MAHQLRPEELRRTFDVTSLGIETTEGLQPLTGIIGQKRAVSALEFGLGIEQEGFNIYVAGMPGTGRMTAVQAFLEKLAQGKASPPDWCYVNNFADPYQPTALSLPAGRGRQFQQDMKSLVEHVRREMPAAFESEEYNSKRDEILQALNEEREAVLQRLARRAGEASFAIKATPPGITMIPLLGGRPLTDSDVEAMPAQAREELEHRRDALQSDLKAAVKEVRRLERAVQERLETLDREVALYLVGGLFEDLREKYQDSPGVGEYLDKVHKDLLENIEAFKARPAEPPSPLPTPGSDATALRLRRYQVNVLVDNSRRQGAPVCIETNPSYPNLFGRIEKEAQFGALHTDFTMIRPGALHRANGGYLVVPAEDLLRSVATWDGLKRALRSREIEIEDLGERLGFLAIKSLRPEPIPFNGKVVLVGRPLLYYLLYAYDEEFAELFKARADFDTRMGTSPEEIRDFVGLLCAVCQKERLAPLDAGAVGKLLEHAARLAEDQQKLSTHFGAVTDLLREAHYWAQQEGASTVTTAHVGKALDAKVYRSNLMQERVQEMITRGTLLIDISGEATGQVNGLSVLGAGDYTFGRPSRITASVGPGRQGIVDIEREVKLGGPIHSKGVLILSGYLTSRYAQDKPLSLSARVVFEQSYEAVEGDSASSAELYALLSALAGLPIRQGIAVTGSVNQHGDVQAIGGVNQKIEGFFDVCRAKGLTGAQGVLIPDNNRQHLMLREDVVEAVDAGQFRIWAVTTIDEGVEVLTGVPAGERSPDGRFPEDSVNGRVERRLREFAESLREFPHAAEPVPAGEPSESTSSELSLNPADGARTASREPN